MAEPPLYPRLSVVRKLSYGVGHVLNDLCASMWFTYLLIFYHKVIGMNNILAGSLLLIGQVADALATPFVGYESDRINGFCGYGKRKSWHLIGCLCVAASFAFIFNPMLGQDPMFYTVDTESMNLEYLIYYAPFIVIFQFGWASTQISHLSLIPSLSSCQHDKVGLNSIRYAFTVISNLMVYVIAWYLLNQDNEGKVSTGVQDVTPVDYITFRTLAFIVIGIGVIFAVIFHVGTKEKSLDQEDTLTTSVRTRMYVMCWLKTPQFYMVALLYMCTRLIVNLSQVYMSMYLTETLSLSKTYIAIVPLVIYISGFLVTFLLKLLSQKLGKKKTYTLGLLFIIGASFWFYMLRENVYPDQYLVMAAGALNGIGGSTILVLSLSLTADLIDHNTESAAFVYGAMSFTDKLSNGLAVQLIQIFHPCKTTSCCEACKPFYRDIMTFVPIGFSIIAFLAIVFLRKRDTEYTLVAEDAEVIAPMNTNVPSYGSINNNPDDDPSVAVTKSATQPEPISPTVDADHLHPAGHHAHNSGIHQRPSFIVGSTPDCSSHSP